MLEALWAGGYHLDPLCAKVFATVINHPSSRWPATGFALCGARPQVAEVLGRLRVPDFLPVYASLDEALDAVLARPPYLRDELLLVPTLTAPAAARAFIRQVCRYWSSAGIASTSRCVTAARGCCAWSPLPT